MTPLREAIERFKADLSDDRFVTVILGKGDARLILAAAEESERLRAHIDSEIARYEGMIAAGKGTWPKPGYVQDETWARWHASLYTLKDAARALTGDEKC